VAQRPLQNYLRTHRRRADLSQEEVATLLGGASGTKVSRHENFARTPSVLTVFAYEVVFGRPAREIFAGAYEEVRLAVRSRARQLANRLIKGAPNPQAARTLRKIELLRSIVDQKPPSARRG
jgi:transcriptional regulator with XRE-family HTH domain